MLNNGDTTICFSINQSKFLLKNSIQLEASLLELKAAEDIIVYKDSLLVKKDLQLNNWELYKINTDSLSILNDQKTNFLRGELTTQRKLLKKETRAKFLALFVGIAATSITTTLYIMK